jgi:hypothetical protein
LNNLPNEFDVTVLDVPLILSEMNGDAVSSRHLCNSDSGYWFRFYPSPSLSEGGNMIDVNMKSNHGFLKR